MSPRPPFTSMLRERLSAAIDRSGLGKGEFAERAGVDRTTLSQLLSTDTSRLPRLDTVVALATAHDLSLDWLVGRSDAGPMEAELVQHTTSFEAPGPTPADERLLGWLDEASDHKIRYVPSTLPDLLKIDAVIRYERAQSIDRDVVNEIDTTAARLTWARNPDTEMECCSTVQSLRAFASGDGLFGRLDRTTRRQQLEHMIQLVHELYPAFRWYLFDGLRRYAAPVTVFGTQRAALYLGDLYLVLTSRDHVRTLSRHFDRLIRDAQVQPTSVGAHLSRLLRHTER